MIKRLTFGNVRLGFGSCFCKGRFVHGGPQQFVQLVLLVRGDGCGMLERCRQRR